MPSVYVETSIVSYLTARAAIAQPVGGSLAGSNGIVVESPAPGFRPLHFGLGD